jgi:hypothetical protein
MSCVTNRNVAGKKLSTKEQETLVGNFSFEQKILARIFSFVLMMNMCREN